VRVKENREEDGGHRFLKSPGSRDGNVDNNRGKGAVGIEKGGNTISYRPTQLSDPHGYGRWKGCFRIQGTSGQKVPDESRNAAKSYAKIGEGVKHGAVRKSMTQ